MSDSTNINSDNEYYRDGMSYGEFRCLFSTVEDFRRAYGALTISQVTNLIDKDGGASFIQAAKYTTWKGCREEYLKAHEVK